MRNRSDITHDEHDAWAAVRLSRIRFARILSNARACYELHGPMTASIDQNFCNYTDLADGTH